MFQMTIRMDNEGGFQLEGPVNNRALCEAMMAGARVCLERHEREQARQGVQPVNGIDLSGILRGGR